MKMLRAVFVHQFCVTRPKVKVHSCTFLTVLKNNKKEIHQVLLTRPPRNFRSPGYLEALKQFAPFAPPHGGPDPHN